MIAETAMLLMVEGPAPGKRIFMDQPVLLIGRDERCDIVIAERQVSRHHASITLEDDSHVVRDLGSKNGTFVNGQELDGRALNVNEAKPRTQDGNRPGGNGYRRSY